MGNEFFHEEFPPFIIELQLHINILVLLTIVIALKVWGKCLRGKKVVILCDNMTSCNLINRVSRKIYFIGNGSFRPLSRSP